MAVSSVKGDGGQWKTNYTNCIAWDKAAEVATIIRKGDTVLCVGTMETNTGNDGKTYKNMGYRFDRMIACSSREYTRRCY